MWHSLTKHSVFWMKHNQISFFYKLLLLGNSESLWFCCVKVAVGFNAFITVLAWCWAGVSGYNVHKQLMIWYAAPISTIVQLFKNFPFEIHTALKNHSNNLVLLSRPDLVRRVIQAFKVLKGFCVTLSSDVYLQQLLNFPKTITTGM